MILDWLLRRFAIARFRRLLRQFPEPPPEAFQRSPERAARALRLRDRLAETVRRLESGSADPGEEIGRLKREFQRERG